MNLSNNWTCGINNFSMFNIVWYLHCMTQQRQKKYVTQAHMKWVVRPWSFSAKVHARNPTFKCEKENFQLPP